MTEQVYRVDRALLKGDRALHLLLALDFIFGFWIWSSLPARVPIHWGIDGQPNDWGPSWVNAILMPFATLLVYLILLFVPLLDPKRNNYALFQGTLRMFRFVIPLLTIFMHLLIVASSLGWKVDMSLGIRAGLPLMFILIGNSFGRLRHNYFFGIRVPWTLNSEEVWNATHRMAAKLWVGGGLLLLVLAFTLPIVPGTIAFGTIILILAVVPIVYSFVLSRRLGM